jgi:signal transduction histidine kinase
VALGARVEDGHWVVEIRDHGPGIDPADLRRAFEPFFRGRADARGGAPGSGLGLAICAQLAERLGGAVDLENAPDGGTTARLLLPLGAPGGEEAP